MQSSTQKPLTEEEKKYKESVLKYRDEVYCLGLSSLQNQGNTCYMNSVIQFLCHAPILNTIIRDNIFRNAIINSLISKKKISITEVDNISKETFSYKVYKLFNQLWSTNHINIPETFKTEIGKLNSEFIGFNQNDSHELLTNVFDKIFEETSILVEPKELKFKLDKEDSITNLLKIIKEFSEVVNKNNVDPSIKKMMHENILKKITSEPDVYINMCAIENLKKYVSKIGLSPLHNLVNFTILEMKKCKCCNYFNPKFEFKPMLTIFISNKKKNPKLSDLINDTFSETEEITDFKCDICKKKVNCVGSTHLYELPEVAIFHLSRFTSSYGHRGRQITKNDKFIEIDKEIKLTTTATKKQNKYKVCGVIHHTGIYTGGHYYCYMKNQIKDKWYKFDDSSVSMVPDKFVDKDIFNSKVYMVMYEKVKDV